MLAFIDYHGKGNNHVANNHIASIRVAAVMP